MVASALATKSKRAFLIEGSLRAAAKIEFQTEDDTDGDPGKENVVKCTGVGGLCASCSARDTTRNIALSMCAPN